MEVLETKFQNVQSSLEKMHFFQLPAQSIKLKLLVNNYESSCRKWNYRNVSLKGGKKNLKCFYKFLCLEIQIWDRRWVLVGKIHFPSLFSCEASLTTLKMIDWRTHWRADGPLAFFTYFGLIWPILTYFDLFWPNLT